MTYFRAFTLIALTAGLQACAAPPLDAPRAGHFDVGYRAGVNLGKGQPANDLIVPAALTGRYHIDERWAVGASLEFPGGDFEGPTKAIGLNQAGSKVIDATAGWTQFMFWAERALTAPDDPNRFFVLAGLGFASVDVDDVSGPLQGGGTFNIKTDAGSEVIPTIGFGYQRNLGKGWSFDATARYDRHMGEWDIVDVSGARGTLDDYSLYSFLFGFSYGW